MGVYEKCHGFLSINAQIAQYLSTHQISFTILSFDIVSVQTYARPIHFGENPTEIQDMQS